LGTLERITSFVSRFVPDATPEKVCGWIDRGAAQSAERFWTLDPIDGTKGFLRGDQYAVALALVYDGRVQVGALGCPNLSLGKGEGVLMVAARGQGTWMAPLEGSPDFVQVSVSPQGDPARARLLRSFESGHTNVSQIDVLARALGVAADPVCMDSQAKYAVLAAGGGEIYLRLLSPSRPDYREKIWDQAAGSIVIEEAGGRVTDLDGLPLDFTRGRTLAANRGICATNGVLHAGTLAALKAIEA
jgi:3'(2'), 5'-bisphosphate nucleotidase